MHDAPPSDKPVHLLNDVQQLKVIPCRYTSAATCGGGRCRHEVCLDTCKKKKASWPIPSPPLHYISADEILLTSAACSHFCTHLFHAATNLISTMKVFALGARNLLYQLSWNPGLSRRETGDGASEVVKRLGWRGRIVWAGEEVLGWRKKIIEESGNGGRGGSAEEGRISFLRMMMTTVTRLLEQKKQQSAVCKDGGGGKEHKC